MSAVEVAARAIALEESVQNDGSENHAWVDAVLAATIHDGDCTKQAHTCLLCERIRYERFARAAIASLREPSPEMRAAMWHATADDWSGDPDAMFVTAWAAGIDAALAEPTPGETGGE